MTASDISAISAYMYAFDVSPVFTISTVWFTSLIAACPITLTLFSYRFSKTTIVFPASSELLNVNVTSTLQSAFCAVNDAEPVISFPSLSKNFSPVS